MNRSKYPDPFTEEMQIRKDELKAQQNANRIEGMKLLLQTCPSIAPVLNQLCEYGLKRLPVPTNVMISTPDYSPINNSDREAAISIVRQFLENPTDELQNEALEAFETVIGRKRRATSKHTPTPYAKRDPEESL
jgi:hypothetical protein